MSGTGERTYDVFLVHTAADEAFVRGYLVPALEVAPERVLFPGELTPGEPLVAGRRRGIARSRVMVLVLSTAGSRDRLMVLGNSLAAFAAGLGACVVSVLLDDCEIPNSARAGALIEFRDASAWPTQARALRDVVAAHGAIEVPGSSGAGFELEGATAIRLAGKDPIYEHEVFILHADADAPFVRGFLVPELGVPNESVLLSSEPALGGSRIHELTHAVSTSQRTIVALSPAFLADSWTVFAEELASYESGIEARLVPVILEDCSVPLQLAFRVAVDLRDPARRREAAARLRKELRQPLPVEPPIQCPYPGMRPFRSVEARRFHGREREIEEVCGRLDRAEREIYVIGPSGSGKSSLIAAGILPRLAATTLVRSIRPGLQPVERLHEALDGDVAVLLSRHPGTSGAIVFVDQLEELFTNQDSAAARDFVRAVHALRSDARVAMIFALRADFYGALMTSGLWPEDGRSIAQIDVAPLRGDTLRRAIEQPARDVDVYLEARLVDRLLADAATEPGVLPLLQETLVQLWTARQRRFLPLEAYEALGVDGRNGLAVTLGRRAQATLSALSPVQQTIARGLLLQLVSFGENRSHTRRSRRRSDLVGERAGAVEPGATLDRLISARLLTADRLEQTDDAWIDMAHEILISAWPTLRAWIEQGRADEQRRRILEGKAREWVERGSGQASLLDEVELAEAEQWLGRSADAELRNSSELKELLAASRVAVERLHHERAETERQRNEYRRILALTYEDQGRQVLLDGKPLRALPYLVAARAAGLDTVPLRMLFAQAIHDVERVLVRHDKAVASVAFTPDGTRLATASFDHTARVWDAVSGEPVSPPLVHQAPVLSVAFSPDGARVATASDDGTACVWDAATGRALTPALRHTGRVVVVAFSPDGLRILTASHDRTARVWDAATGQPSAPPFEHQDEVVAAVFSPDGTRLATASHDKTARVWDAAGGGPVTPPLDHGQPVVAVAFSPDGGRLATASWNHTARVWDATSGEPVTPVLEHDDPVVAVAFSPDGGRIATASEDRTARIWDAATGEPRTPPLPHADAVRVVAFSPDGDSLVTASDDRTARLWSAMSGRPITPPLEHLDWVVAASFSGDGSRIATASNDTTARIWAGAAHRATGLQLEHDGSLEAAAFSPDGARIATAADDCVARVWDAVTGEPVTPPLQHLEPVVAIAFSPDGLRIVTASEDRTARVWNAASGQPITPPLEHLATVTGVAFDRTGMRVATASEDCTARLWDAASGRLLVPALEHGGHVTDVAFSPDGTRVVTASQDGTARIWDAATGAERVRCVGHEAGLEAAVWNPDGTRVATASNDKTARVWDAGSGALVAPPLVHRDGVVDVAFSPDNARIVTASDDRTACIWDAASGRPLTQPMEHDDNVVTAAFSCDGTCVVTASWDARARVWDAASGKLLVPPLVHQGMLEAAEFSPDGGRVLTASWDQAAHVWDLPADPRSLEQWSALADWYSPYALQDGVLVPRAGGPRSIPRRP